MYIYIYNLPHTVVGVTDSKKINYKCWGVWTTDWVCKEIVG